MHGSTQKRSASMLTDRGSRFEEDLTHLSLTYGITSPDGVTKGINEALPVVKRLCVLLPAIKEEMEEYQRMRAPDGLFHCEKCHEVKSSSKLMYPTQEQSRFPEHQCKQWPRWCDRCVADSLPKKCPGEGCYANVEWTGGTEFFVHVEVRQIISKWNEKVVAQFGLFLEPAIATLRTIKQAVQDKTGVLIQNQRCTLTGVEKPLTGLDKTLVELNVGKAAKFVVTHK